MATDATGTPTSLGIPKIDPTNDAPSGLGINAMMDAIDPLIAARIEAPPSPSLGDSLTWDGSDWVASSGGTPSVIPVSLTTPQVSSNAGNSFWSVLGLTDWDAGHWEFVKDVKGKVFGHVLVPDGVTAATLRLVIAANATSGVTRLNIAYAPVANGESLNPSSLTDGAAQDITVPGTAYLRKDVTFSLTGLSGADQVIVEIFHEGDHGNDSLAVNTLLFGAWLEPA